MQYVSIILPTYNREDTIKRAIDGVLNQTYQDWELIVIDDGSTDNTLDMISDIDPRIRIIQQKKSGCYAARNLGINRSRGQLITFLDSDDEWFKHYLEITTSFLKWKQEAQFVTTEFYEDWGDGNMILHDKSDIADRFTKKARQIGSNNFELPPGETDDYLRVYKSKEEVGSWGEGALELAGTTSAYVYYGDLFEYMKWGYLNWLPITMVRKTAISNVGLFSTATKNAADYRFLALLAKNYQASMIAVPSAIKYSQSPIKKKLKEEHLASGKNEYLFAINRLGYFDELYWDHHKHDLETKLIRSHFKFYISHIAMTLGEREQALKHLEAAACFKPVLWKAYPMKLLAKVVISKHLLRLFYIVINKFARLLSKT